MTNAAGPEERDLNGAIHTIIRELRSFNLKMKSWARDLSILF